MNPKKYKKLIDEVVGDEEYMPTDEVRKKFIFFIVFQIFNKCLVICENVYIFQQIL
jgi:hypothetical protein